MKMEHDTFISYLAVCLGIGTFCSLKEVIHYGTDDAISFVITLMEAIYGDFPVNDEIYNRSVKFGEYKNLENGFSIRINDKTFKSIHRKDVDEDPYNGGAYVLFSDGINFYKFYFGGGGETWESDFRLSPPMDVDEEVK